MQKNSFLYLFYLWYPCIVQAWGGGVTPDEIRVVGQVNATHVYDNGNGSFKVYYEENVV
jgi:hypothetical protein